MKKALFSLGLVATLFIGSANRTMAQSYMHSFGGSYMYAIYDGNVNGIVAGTYVPRLNVAELSDASSIGIVAPTSLAISLNSRVGGSLAFEVMPGAQLSLGHASTQDADGGFGGYFGAGFGFNSIRQDYVGPIIAGSVATTTKGPYVSGGFRFPYRGQYSATAGAYFLVGGNDINVFGLRILLNIGM